MLGKNKFPVIMTVLLIGMASWLLAAPNPVNRLGLTHEGEFTVLTIQGQTALKTAHQSVEAKDGKPFRIVIDCMPARHELQAKNFIDLPVSAIKSIRTSQFSVNPEEVVRVVLDMEGPSVYRVESVENAVKVYISDPKTLPFAAWSSKPSANRINAPKVKQEVASAPKPAQNKPAVVAQKTQPTTQKPVENLNKVASTPAPQKQTSADNKVVTVNTNTAKLNNSTKAVAPKSSTKVASKPQETPQIAKLPAPSEAFINGPFKAETAKVQVNQVQNISNKDKQTTVAKSTDEKEQPKMALAQADKPDSKNNNVPTPGDAPKTKAVQPQKDKNSGTAATTEKMARPVTVAQVDNSKVVAQKPEENKPAASRFRRETAKSLRDKQTQVVEFPKRMVIKYDKTSARDPFKALIEEVPQGGGKGQSHIHVKIPNVETLHLVGILNSVNGKGAALLEDVEGIGYILKPGDKVQNGYVSSVSESSVHFQINEYGWTRTITKKMKNNEF